MTTRMKSAAGRSGKDDRGTAQRDDAIRSHEKAMEKQTTLKATPRLKEKQASMKQDHPKPKYRDK